MSWIIAFCLCQPAPTAELDRSEDKVYQYVMDLVRVVVQLKNDVNTSPSTEYLPLVKVTLWEFKTILGYCGNIDTILRKDGLYWSRCLFFFLSYDHFMLFHVVFFFQQSVGMTLRDLISSVDDVLPSLQGAIRTEVTSQIRCNFPEDYYFFFYLVGSFPSLISYAFFFLHTYLSVL